MHASLTLKQRLVSLLLYVVALTLLSGFATGIWFPTEGGKSIWFFCAIGLFFFSRLSSPFFVTPRDSLANCATAALLLATVDLSSVSVFQNELNAFRWVTVAYASFVAIVSIISISLYPIDKGTHPNLAHLSTIAYRLSEYLGRGHLAFTPLVLISIVGFYQAEPIQQVWLLFFWTILVFIEPVDLALKLLEDVRLFGIEKEKNEAVGEIQRIDDPGILRVRLSSVTTWKRNKVHVAQLADSRQVEVLPLFVQTQNSELVGTGLCHRKPPVDLDGATPGFIYCPESVREANEVLCELCGNTVPAALIGFVVENSTISRIRFEVASDEKLQDGWIVFVRHRGDCVYYQILDARTDEESFSQNPRGAHFVTAQQLGSFDYKKGFLKYGWLPAMNSPVFLASFSEVASAVGDCATDEFELGRLPHSAIPVRASFSDMVHVHTAILGATGMGKTELAFDLIRKAIQSQMKVVCVDFTGEYRPRLKDLKPEQLGLEEEQGKTLQERLFDVETGKYHAEEQKRALQEFLDEIKPVIEDQVEQFLKKDGAGLGIFELEEIANTKATLRATELYLSTIFKWARNNRKERDILLVLEEAHTIVPEANLFPYDRVETGAVVGRLGQIALQGRKYGVGLLLISQRTALVSKTLLSQCNTVLCFAMHDETGLNYLRTVFNSEHVSLIPNLKPLQAVAFGGAIRSEHPIVFEIPEDENKKKASDALRIGTLD